MARLWFRSQALTTGRVEAFSDGVIAVAITLLALDLKLPPNLDSDGEIWRAALGLIPGLVAWIISFFFLLTIWINHHYLFDSVRAVDRGLLWLNGFFLLTVTVIPLPTSLVGAYAGRSAPLALLSATMFLASLSFTLMRLYLTRRPDLAKASNSAAERRIALARSALGPTIYAIAFAVSFVVPLAAIGCQIVALLLFIFGPPHFSRSPDEKTP
jgi:uncharacterized membrane protein